LLDPKVESRTQQPRSTRFIRHIEPDPNCIWCKQEETVEHILEHCPKIEDEPRELLIYQLVLESDKLEEERNQLTTRQKLDRESRTTSTSSSDQKNPTRNTKKNRRPENNKKHKKNHPVEA